MPADHKVTQVDLRTIAPHARFAVATYTSHLLRPGEAMELTDEYDPVDLFVGFQRRSEELRWEYLERGPKVWRIRVQRTSPPATAAAEETTFGQVPVPA